MQLLISDANILIDLEEGELLNVFFRLPYQFKVPDILFVEELEEQHSHLIEMGLQLGELSEKTMMYAFQLNQRVNGPSMNDCFALALARQEACPILTGDEALRVLAKREAVVVMGTIWVVEQLILHNIITVAIAREAYEKMRSNGRRLPWHLAFSRLEHQD
ncbi:conserved hypothetical protein [Tolumonas auensis DSM 9187]|uniref:DUF3368 domain-containing protein n=1 Tax=Tolumonas auensis (strain DSM 9187 / NBRC 110442 / TA 4) TaxID=595494 RepID=C4LD92_TOLAT|nr:PIN domain-containing protein [Tolumonas auensis]ACQ94623.1 conserved hypothetical protein [Tolumonas auensis DSM 9187]